MDVFRYLGIPLALDKIEGPAHTIKFLGILLDCIAMEARLPEEKLCELRNLLQGFMSQHTVTLRELASLMGKLLFASQVVVPGQTFMRHLWDLIAKYNRANAKASLPRFIDRRVQTRPGLVEPAVKYMEWKVFLPS